MQRKQTGWLRRTNTTFAAVETIRADRNSVLGEPPKRIDVSVGNVDFNHLKGVNNATAQGVDVPLDHPRLAPWRIFSHLIHD